MGGSTESAALEPYVRCHTCGVPRHGYHRVGEFAAHWSSGGKWRMGRGGMIFLLLQRGVRGKAHAARHFSAQTEKSVTTVSWLQAASPILCPFGRGFVREVLVRGRYLKADVVLLEY